MRSGRLGFTLKDHRPGSCFLRSAPRLLCLFLLLGIPVSAQNNPTFQTGISLVHVDAEVLAKNGRVLTGFSKGDFRVFDEGEEQPLDLVLLIDISRSMRHQVQKVAAAAHQALKELRTGGLPLA